jgi:hypothetical protein
MAYRNPAERRRMGAAEVIDGRGRAMQVDHEPGLDDDGSAPFPVTVPGVRGVA